MILPIHPPSTSTLPRYSMLEFNGVLLPPVPTGQETSIRELGLIWFDKGLPTIIVGSHEIKGSVVQLKKPFLVCRKADGKGCVAEALVETKYLFDSYPKTIMRAREGK